MKNFITILFILCYFPCGSTYALLNPADPTGKTIYPSGIKESDFIYSLPKSKDVLLTLGTDIIDPFNHRIIPHGFYYITLSIEDTDIYIVLYKPYSKFQPVKLPITNYRYNDEPILEAFSYTELTNYGNTLEIGLKFGKYTVYRELKVK